MRKLVLVWLAILVPFGVAAADWKNKITKPPAEATVRGSPVCLSQANCWCRTKRKIFTAGETCQCGATEGRLIWKGQLAAGVQACN